MQWVPHVKSTSADENYLCGASLHENQNFFESTVSQLHIIQLCLTVAKDDRSILGMKFHKLGMLIFIKASDSSKFYSISQFSIKEC